MSAESEITYVKPYRADSGIHFSLALQDGTRQPWKIADTLSNWHFAWWIYACDRPLEPKAEGHADSLPEPITARHP